MIIGITGKSCSGKETVVSYLKKKGFFHISLSDILREEAEKRGIEKSRENLIMLGNELRAKHGANILAKMAMRKINKAKVKNAVISSIRNPSEIKELRKKKNFFLLAIDAPLELRYEREVKRGRENISLKEFIALERKEETKDKNKQQLSKCIKMADRKIINNSTLEELYKKIDEVLKLKK